MPQQYSRSLLALASSTRIRQPSFSPSTQTIYSTRCISWNMTRCGFERGFKSHYDIQFSYSDFQPCPPETAEMMLLFCAAQVNFWEERYELGVKRRTVTFGSTMLGFEGSARQISFGRPRTVTSVKVFCYAIHGPDVEVHFEDRLAESFIRKCEAWEPEQIRKIVYG